jgi:lipoprotein-releasing system permease protein
MYKTLLALKYLRKRRIAWVSLVAVTLCVAMVLVVISIMGGWLRMFRESFKGLSGDVIVTSQQLSGFPHYEEMLGQIEQLPEVAVAMAQIRAYGLINIVNQKSDGVQVYGVQMDKIGKINNFGRSLHRQYNSLIEKADDPKSDLTPQERDELRKKAEANSLSPSFDLPYPPEVYRSLLPGASRDVSKLPGMIASVGVLNIRKNAKGETINRSDGTYQLWAVLSVLGVDQSRQSLDMSNKAEQRYWIVDDSQTKVWQYDSSTVYVPFELLQRDLGMAGTADPDAPPGTVSSDPPRATELHIKLNPGFTLAQGKQAIEKVVRDVLAKHEVTLRYEPVIQTWEESQSLWIGAIEKEKGLVTFLFSLISVVAVFLIFCIFYMIVQEKTKDIGIIKSVGATDGGVALIFILYGAAIGIVGGLAGFTLGFTVVHYINEIHTLLGKYLGLVIWNPEVYAFETIPNTVDPTEATVIVLAAVLSSVVGALVPARRAAKMNPVEALRFE